MFKKPFVTLLAILLASAVVAPGYAQQMILDEEFSAAATALAAPLRKSLVPHTNVHYVLINDPNINAFVTGENIIFVHSGLVAKASTAAALQGVLAHELAHVAANHILQRHTSSRHAAIGAMAGMVLGIGAAAAGSPQAATAIAMGSQAGAIQSMLAHTRTQEAEADRRAITALHTAGLSAQGMVDMFSTLRNESQLSYDAPPPWLVTHPLPPERLANLSNATQTESTALKTGLEKTEASINFPRLQAKVWALTSTPAGTLRRYTGADDISRYARALAYFKQGKLDLANSNLEPLLKADPQDPYYRELKAKLALERSYLTAAGLIFAQLATEYPSAVLFQYQYAEILRNQSDYPAAAARYERTTRLWPQWADPWMGLGLCYGNMGRIAESHLARTNGFIAAPDIEAAKQSLVLAKQYIGKLSSSPEKARAQEWATALQSRLDAME
ncbi:MAG: tetratricopeptide repeat protein [Alphaproteobacteria bacterium]|nr:MAG: tetratricopeptide repeat protein [Alphaproteobacteria bacterium]